MVALFDQTLFDQTLFDQPPASDTERSRDLGSPRQSLQSLQLVAGGRQGADRPSATVEEPEPPGLRLIHGGRSAATEAGGRPLSLALVAAIACVVFGGLLAIRLVQGGPDGSRVAGSTGSAGSEVQPALAADAGPEDLIVVVGPGDTLWSIATEIAPDGDPRPLVSALSDANDGSRLQIGQEIVISARYLD